jgi:hypothetical protein
MVKPFAAGTRHQIWTVFELMSGGPDALVCVVCGMDLAPGERLITREMVAVERPRCSARALMLIEPPEGSPEGSGSSFVRRAMVVDAVV